MTKAPETEAKVIKNVVCTLAIAEILFQLGYAFPRDFARHPARGIIESGAVVGFAGLILYAALVRKLTPHIFLYMGTASACILLGMTLISPADKSPAEMQSLFLLFSVSSSVVMRKRSS